MWIRTPYTPGYFKQFAPLANELDNIRVNDEGTIDVQYMAKIGDDSLYLGSRPPRTASAKSGPKVSLDHVIPLVGQEQKIAASIVETGSATISRVHETRVELDTHCDDQDLDYIRKHSKITDVVIVAPRDAHRLPVSYKPYNYSAERDTPCECLAFAQPQVQL